MTTHSHYTFPSEKLNHSWRETLDRWTEQCLQCLWPDAHQAIDWSKPIEQLKWTVPEASQGVEVVGDTDLVYKVSTLQGESCLLWVHIAFKQETPATLATRLFQLSNQLYAYYQQPILPLVIALETEPSWQPEPYQAVALGYPTHRFEFQTVKLNDWIGQEEALLSSNNPFENIIGIYLQTKSIPEDLEARYTLKLKLHSDLLQQADNKESFLALYTFMDQSIPLPESFDKRYQESVYELERKKQLDYLISSEQFGIDKWVQKGFEEGIEQANRKHLQRMLSKGIDRAVIKSILNITDSELNRLLVLENAEVDSGETLLET